MTFEIQVLLIANIKDYEKKNPEAHLIINHFNWF